MNHLTQEELNTTYPDIIQDLTEEIIRAKLVCNTNGYQIHSAVYIINRRYRDELKMLRETLAMNIDG